MGGGPAGATVGGSGRDTSVPRVDVSCRSSSLCEGAAFRADETSGAWF